MSDSSFPRLTGYTITDPKKIAEEIARTRKRGYGIDNREVHEDLVCIAAPIVTAKGVTLGAISAASTSIDLLGAKRAAALKQLKACADRIEAIF